MPNIANIFTNNKAGAEMGEDATGNILMPVVEMMADSPHELLGRQVQVPKPVACGESGDLSFADMNNNVEQVSDGYTGMQHRFSGAMASNDEQIRNFDPLLRNHRPDLSHTFEDDVWGGDYSDTNLCRWCGPPGHTAIDCVKWDPEHFDKAVCVAGNNKKQGLSDCTTKWPNMSEQERRTLLLERGAGKPGARSDFYPWTKYLDPKAPGPAAYPLTRAFLKSLSDSDVGAVYSFWWCDCNYDEPLPERLIDLQPAAVFSLNRQYVGKSEKGSRNS